MVFIILFAILGIVIGLCAEWGDFDFIAVASVLGMGILGGIFGFTIALIGSGLGTPTEVREVETTDLVCLSDNYSVAGNFYLGYGNIDGEMRYTYLYEEEGKGYTLGCIRASQCYIYVQDPDIPAQLRTITYGRKTGNWFCLDIPRHEYTLYIPQDSIAYGFNIDLQ